MDYICIGMLFVLFDFNVTLAGVRLPLLPDCIGYLTALAGLMQLREESQAIRRACLPAILLAIYSFCRLTAGLLGLISHPFLAYGINLPETAGRLFFLYLLIEGLWQMEVSRRIELYPQRLRKWWALAICFQTFSLLAIKILFLSAVCGIIAVLCNIPFILILNMARINWKNGMARSG